jgi:cell division transport system permease protein
MYMTERGMTDRKSRMDTRWKPPDAIARLLPRAETPIVPKHSIAGRALVAVIAIMSFLASLTIGAVLLVRSAAIEWQSDVAREITIQVRPMPGRDFEADVARAVGIARAFPGVADVRPYSKEESARLLEPWLGGGLALDELPVPRMIVVKLASREEIDLALLRKVLTERVAGASLDDHRAWAERMRAMARTTIIIGVGLLILMLVATVLSVIFATRGAMAVNRPIIEVLHFVGARSEFIARQFQRHFLVLGLQGGMIGSGLAALLFVIAKLAVGMIAGTASGDQLAALFGAFALGVTGYAAIAAQAVLIAVVTAAASRWTVSRTLAAVE